MIKYAVLAVSCISLSSLGMFEPNRFPTSHRSSFSLSDEKEKEEKTNIPQTYCRVTFHSLTSSSSEDNDSWRTQFDNDPRFSNPQNDRSLLNLVQENSLSFNRLATVQHFTKFNGFVSPEGKKAALQMCTDNDVKNAIQQLPARPYKTAKTFLTIKMPSTLHNNETPDNVSDKHLLRWNAQTKKITRNQSF